MSHFHRSARTVAVALLAGPVFTGTTLLAQSGAPTVASSPTAPHAITPQDI
jgi:hypothetical protein